LPDFGEPQIYFDDCELIGTAYEDAYFYVVPDACYKIVRTWTVINWCVYDEFGEDVYIEYPECNVFPPFTDWDEDGDSDCRTSAMDTMILLLLVLPVSLTDTSLGNK
jgi:hypothetical protein